MKKCVAIVTMVVVMSCTKQSSEEHLNSAKQNLNQNDYQAAAIELKNAIKISPELAEARFLLGKVYLDQKQFQNAEKELNKALELNYPAENVVPLLSLAYQKTGSDVALLDLSHSMNGIAPDAAAEVALYKIQAMVRLEQKEKAKQLIDEVQKLNTDSEFKALALVYGLLLDEQQEAGQLQLDQLLKNNPKQEHALKLRALILIKNGELEQAADTYLNYLAHYPEDLEIAFISARLLVQLNRTTQAEPFIDQLLTVNAEHGLLNQLKGIVRFNEKDAAGALEYTEKSIVASPNDPALRLLAGYSAYQLEDYEVAHRHLLLIAPDLPADHEALRLLASAQLRLGLNSEASETIAAIEDLTDKDNTLVSSVGLALLQSGEVEKARTILKRSDDLEAQTAEDLTRMGLLKLSLNDISGIAKLEEALDQKPQEKFTRKTLATAYLTSNQLDKALALSKSWKKENQEDIQAYALAAAVYIKQKEFELAKAQLNQILEIEPENAETRISLADLFLLEQDSIEAQKVIDQVLAQHPAHVAALAKNYGLALKQQNTKDALKLIEQQHLKHTENKGLILLLAKVYLFENSPEKTIELISDYEHEGAPKIFWQTLGAAYLRNRQYDELTKHYKSWLELEPNNRNAVVGNLMLLDNQRKYKEALQISRKFVETDSTDIEISLFDLHFLLLNGEIDEAKSKFDKIPESALNVPFAKGILGQIQMMEKKFSDALLNLRAAYKVQPTARNVRLILICLSNTGQQGQSEPFLTTHVANNPNDGESLMQLAQLQIASDVDGAIVSYEQALKINDKNFIALNNLAYFYLERDLVEKALEYGNRALAIRPGNADILDTVGRIYIKRKEFSRAVEYLNKAISSGDVQDDIYLNYVEALLLDNQKVLATRKLEQREFSQTQSLQRAEELRKQLGS